MAYDMQAAAAALDLEAARIDLEGLRGHAAQEGERLQRARTQRQQEEGRHQAVLWQVEQLQKLVQVCVRVWPVAV